MRKIFCKKTLYRISLSVLLFFCSIPKLSLGIIDDQGTEILNQVQDDKNGVDIFMDANLQCKDFITESLNQVQDDKNGDHSKNRQDNPAITVQVSNYTLETLIQKNATDEQAGNAIADININIDMDIQDEELHDGKIRSFEPDEKLSAFYSEYIAKYYPKAYVIRQKFIDMTPEQIAEALNDIVHVFTKEPWFYFRNSPKGFRLIYYWEYVLDQCGIIHDFLKHAKVDLKTKKITLEYSFAWDDYAGYFNYQEDILAPRSQPLLSYLQKNHLSAYTAFFSLSFDYQIKFFNEGILLKNLTQANKYFGEIEYCLEKLRNTPKESDYYESTKICKELLGILKRKLGIDNLNNLEKTSSDGTGDTSNYYKEFTELNDVV
jgi:hypothetical protein